MTLQSGWYGYGKKDLERGRTTEEYMTLRRKTLHLKRKIWLSDITPLIVVKPYKDEGGGDKKNKQRVIKSYQGIFDILHNIHLFSAGNIQVCPLISLRAVHAYHRYWQLGRASKKMWNLGFWLKLGGGGVWAGSMSPTCYQVFFLLLKNDLIGPKHEKSLKIKMI